MLVYVALLLFFSGSAVAKKRGDFGIFTACKTKNGTIRLECKYAPCNGSPPFDCEFIASDNYSIESNTKCQLIVPMIENTVTNYTCKLTRKGRHETKNIEINLTTRKRMKKIVSCPATTGLRVHRAPALLFPVVSLSLWRVLVTDSLTT